MTLPLLDRELLRAGPKPFFGLSDNTHLPAFLYTTGIVGCHGGTVMTALGRSVAMDPLTAHSLRAVRAYAPGTTIVFDVDLGHTDPQVVIPYGGVIRVGGPARRITVTY